MMAFFLENAIPPSLMVSFEGKQKHNSRQCESTFLTKKNQYKSKTIMDPELNLNIEVCLTV